MKTARIIEGALPVLLGRFSISGIWLHMRDKIGISLSLGKRVKGYISQKHNLIGELDCVDELKMKIARKEEFLI